MKNGDLVFFKRARKTSGPNAPEIQFDGLGFGVLLGHQPPGVVGEPSRGHVIRLLGSVGFVSFDDVIELLTREQGELLVQKFLFKYYGNHSQGEKPSLVLAPPASPSPPDSL